MLTIKTDMMQTVAIAIIVLYIGRFLRKRIAFFERFCVPAPVIGGFLFAIIHLILKVSGIATFTMDTTLKGPFMMVFFTTIGLGASLDTLKKGGKGLLIFGFVSILLVFLQDAVGMGLAKLLGQDSLLGLLCGSITMVGGHGTAGAWGPTFENLYNYSGATTVGMAAATFGVIMGSLIGGPIGSGLIKKYGLHGKASDVPQFDVTDIDGDGTISKSEINRQITTNDFLKALGIIFVSIALGVILKNLIYNNIKIAGKPMVLPEYVTSMLFAGIFTNTFGKRKDRAVDPRVNAILGDLGLNIFLVIALIELDLTQLKTVAGPMLIILSVQTILMALFAVFVCFRAMGKDYDAAVLTGGICGFGMGATYNALANMDSITEEYGPAPKAYFILPMIGAFAIDIINTLIITGFIQLR